MNTRKDFQRAVNLIASTAAEGTSERKVLVETFITFFKGDNPRFDTAKFLAAILRYDLS